MNPTLIVGAVALALLGWALYERGDSIQARADQATAERVLATNAQALKELQRDRAATVSALESAAAGQRAAAAALQSVRSAAYAAPPSSACVTHPAARALRDSLRAAAARRSAGGAAGAATQPDGPVRGAADAR